MFDNPDFEGAPNIFMALAILCGYDALYDFSKVLGLTWIDTSANVRGIYKSASFTPDLFNLILTVLCLTPALYISIKRCIKRIKLGKLSTKQIVTAYLKSLAGYAIAFFLVIIFVPIITPYLRGWKSIF